MALVLIAAGCGGHNNVLVVAHSGPPPGSPTAASVSVSSSKNSIVADLIVIGAMLGLYHASERQAAEYGARTRANPFDAIQPSMLASRFDPSRRVLEQDCTKPIEDWSANLKCR